MTSFRTCLLLFSIFIATISAFGGSDDKFLKKYAMMKIYESCFGPEVVKQIRKEMTEACQKCAQLSETAIIIPPEPPQAQNEQHASQRPGDTPLPPAQSDEGIKHGIVPPLISGESGVQENVVHQPSFDAEKLHQAILAYRPGPFPQPQAQYRPQFSPAPQPFYPGFGSPAPLFYSGGYPSPYPQYPQFPTAFYPNQFYGGHGQRMSREMNLRDQMDVLTNRISGRVRNVTCVMQELGYLDDNLEPNFDKIIERIASLPVQEELKRDMQDGVTFCQKFSQCIPDVKRENSPLSRELIKPMFFFKCYKHKKLEACVMKDVRERFTQETDTDFESLAEGIRSDDTRQFRNAKVMKQPTSKEAEYERFTSELYEFLYGGNNEFDSLF